MTAHALIAGRLHGEPVTRPTCNGGTVMFFKLKVANGARPNGGTSRRFLRRRGRSWKASAKATLSRSSASFTPSYLNTMANSASSAA